MSTGGVASPFGIFSLLVGVGGHARIRRAHVLLISTALGIVAARLLDLRPAVASAPAQVAFWALPAVVVAVAVAAVLVVASGSSRNLAFLVSLGLPEIGARQRARANGLIWSGVGFLMVHFTAPAFAFVPGGAIVVGLGFGSLLGFGAMRLHLAAIDHEAYRSFNLVAMLLAAGSLASMSITPTGEWWTYNFSTLGTSDDLAAAAFNVAVTMSGLGMALLGPALTSATVADRFQLRRGGLTAMRVLIALIGVSLMGVGLVPIDGATDLHNLFACGAAAGFAVLSLGVQLWARRMPRGLVVFSYAALTVEVAAMLAYDTFKIFNLTVFEIIAFALVFAWLIALVATTAGAAAETEGAGESVLAAESPGAQPTVVRSTAGREPVRVRAAVPGDVADALRLARHQAPHRSRARGAASPGPRRVPVQGVPVKSAPVRCAPARPPAAGPLRVRA